MNNLQETASWVNEIVDNAIKTEKKLQPKRCHFISRRKKKR